MTSSLRLHAPDRLTYQSRSVSVGATVYRALEAVRSQGGRIGLRELSLAVWGVPEVARRAVWSLTHRMNEKLAAVGFPGRAGVDAGEMLVC